MKINNAFEMEEWRRGIGTVLTKAHFADTKEGFMAYIVHYFPSLYNELKAGLPININDWNWKQIAEYFC